MSRGRLLPALVLSLALGASLAGCSSDTGAAAAATNEASEPIVIATTNFTETKILASMYEQVLEKAGQPAEVKELTTREVIAPALEAGEVQLTPEYLGSLTEFLNKAANGPDAQQVASGDVAATYAAAQDLAEPRSITLLQPSAAQDQNAFAVTQDFAAANNLATLSDLGTYSQGTPLSLAGPPECPQRPFCQLGLEDVYEVKVAEFVPLDAGGPLTIQAIEQGKVDVGLVFSSSGAVTADELVVLADDKQWQTAENILPALHAPSVTATISTALDSVSKALTTDELQALNARVEIDRQDPDAVAAAFLQSKGLL
ncbi:MAG TPA: ABC transporter substrate-binding protein [Candidatus Nanopelagicales bacterium]